MPGTAPVVMYVATGSLSIGFGLGLTARAWPGRRVPRALHHLAFAASCVSLAGVTIREVRRAPLVALADAAALAVLGTLPRTSGGSRNHATVASIAGALHVLGVAARRRDVNGR